MKPSVALLAALVLLGGLAIAWLYTRATSTAREVQALLPEPDSITAPVRSPESADTESELRSRLDRLAEQVDDLAREVAALTRLVDARPPASPPSSAEDRRWTPQFEKRIEESVLRVLAAERERIALIEDLKTIDGVVQSSIARLSLPESSADGLRSVLVEWRRRGRAIFEAFSPSYEWLEKGDPNHPEWSRALHELDTWVEGELGRLYPSWNPRELKREFGGYFNSFLRPAPGASGGR